jgi:dTDP-4-dehydrorhamnose 3,5-epimerase
MRFRVEATRIADVMCIERLPLADARGFLERVYCATDLAAAGFEQPIAQINHSLTRSVGSVRGLHYQRPPHAESKLVSCLAGSVFDVAVDLRRRSPTFLAWHAEVLSAVNHRSLLIPEGCAHGFQVLEPDTELLYLHTAAFAPDAEGALNVRDPRLAIEWPVTITGLSDRDAAHPFIAEDWSGIDL